MRLQLLVLLAGLASVVAAPSAIANDELLSPFDLGNRALVSGDDDAAIRHYQLELERPDSPHKELVLFLVGKSLDRTGRWIEAEAMFRKLAEEYPQGQYTDDALVYVGNHYKESSQRKDLAQAIKWFMFVVQRFADSPLAAEARVSAGEVFASVGEFDRAEEFLRPGIENLTGELQARALFSLAQLLSNPANPKRDLPQAQALFERIIGEHPDFSSRPAVLFALGSCHRSLHKWDAALDTFSSLVKDYPDDFFAPYARSYLSLIQREKKEQELSLKKFLDILTQGAATPPQPAQTGDASVIINLIQKNKDQIAIEADSMDFNREEKLARYQGNVTVRGEGVEVRADTLQVDLANKMLEGSGNIRFAQGTDVQVQGQTLTWDMRAGHLVAKGDVVLTQNTPSGETVSHQDEVVITLQPADPAFDSETRDK